MQDRPDAPEDLAPDGPLPGDPEHKKPIANQERRDKSVGGGSRRSPARLPKRKEPATGAVCGSGIETAADSPYSTTRAPAAGVDNCRSAFSPFARIRGPLPGWASPRRVPSNQTPLWTPGVLPA